MRVFITAIAIAAGLFVLAGYFIQMDALIGLDLQVLLIDWAIIIAGWAVLVGVFNLAAVQVDKFRTRQKGGMYGLLLVISLVATFAAGIAGLIISGPENLFMRLAIDAVIVPVEASLMAILAVTLIYASIRLLRRRVDVMSIVFLVVALLFMILTVLIPLGLFPSDQALAVLGTFSRGGGRGLLIGIALGTLLTGLRVLFGVDRPYGGN
jgi:hypothetical protein